MVNEFIPKLNPKIEDLIEPEKREASKYEKGTSIAEITNKFLLKEKSLFFTLSNNQVTKSKKTKVINRVSLPTKNENVCVGIKKIGKRKLNTATKLKEKFFVEIEFAF